MENKIKSKILFIKSKKEDDIIFDAINNYICNLNSCKELRFHSYYYVNNEKEFIIEEKKQIFCKLIKLELNDENVNSYSLEIYSYLVELEQLKNFINELKKKYIYERNNKLDNLKYYFDEHHVSLMRNRDDTIKFSTALNEIVFKMTQFNTNKSLKNVFGNHLKLIKERMDLFTKNPKWYEDKGIPHTLGILLHGPPGTGKTSIIKAIAKDTNRHIFNIKLYEDTTRTQIHNLFFNENVKVIKNGQTEIYTIPLSERIYVLEDIDCDNELLIDRELKKKKEVKQTKTTDYIHSFEGRYEDYDINKIHYSEYCNNLESSNKSNHLKENLNIQEDTSEQLTLSYILNILDGILETPGRILIMTTNYPERLDKALIRPGRIDINLEVGYCDLDMIKEMYYFFYNKCFIFEEKIINNITPAQLNKILQDNFNDSGNGAVEIKKFLLKK